MKRGRDDEGAAAAEVARADKKTHVETGANKGFNGFASLPLATLAHVWSFAVSMEVSDGVCECAEADLLQRNVHDLQLVCRAWRENMQEILRERLRGVAIVDVAAAAKKHGEDIAPLVLRVESFDKASPATDLRVVMGDIFSGHDYNDRGFWMDDEQALIAVRVQRAAALLKSIPEIDWDATLESCGEKITRLDLSRMLLYTNHLGSLLRTAAKRCPNVKAVIMPPMEKKHYKKEAVRKDNMEALSEATKAWRKSNGGLTHLRVPYLGLDLVGSVLYVNDLTVHCPGLEHTDGSRFTFIEQCNMEFVTCDEFIYTPPELWGNFWGKSTKLKSFNTVVVPFNSDYYSEFAEHVKPNLEDLTISFNSLVADPSEDMDSELFQDIVKCMPALRKLSIICAESNDDEWTAGNAFDDAFLVALSQSCRKLEKLVLKSFTDLEKITVAGLEAVLGLRELQSLSVRSMLTLEDSFLDLFEKQIHEKRSLHLRVTAVRVRDMIWKVLARVADMKTEEFNGVSLSLTIKTHEAFGFVLAKDDDQNARCHEIADVHILYNELKRVHGNTVRVHLHTTLPSEEHDSKSVLFDSLELSINDPQGFSCTRDKFTECGNDDIEQELCGESIRVDGVFEREPEGALKDLEMIMENSRPRRVYVPGLMSDDEAEEEGEDGEGGEFDDEIDGEEYSGGDDTGGDSEDDEDDDGSGDDEGGIFGNGEEDEVTGIFDGDDDDDDDDDDDGATDEGTDED